MVLILTSLLLIAKVVL